MSGGRACACAKDRRDWVVLTREGNHSKFNGRRFQSSAYSAIRCLTCAAVWRTRADYVAGLRDASTDERRLPVSDLFRGAWTCPVCGAERRGRGQAYAIDVGRGVTYLGREGMIVLEAGDFVCWYHESIEREIRRLELIVDAGDAADPDELQRELARLRAGLAQSHKAD